MNKDESMNQLDCEKKDQTTKRLSARYIGLVSITVLLFGVLCGGGVYGHWVFSDYRWASITEGEVYRSGAMPPETLKDKVRQYRIKTVLDLRGPEHKEEIDAERSALGQIGVLHINLPSEQIPADTTVEAFLKTMDNRKNRPVLIHCNHGTGRAVLFSAIYRIEYERWSNERARRASKFFLYDSSFSADGDKGIFLRKYVPRLRRSTHNSS